MARVDRTHEIDLLLEGMIGSRVRVGAHRVSSGPMAKVLVPGCLLTVTRLKWRWQAPGWYFEGFDEQNRFRAVPCLACPKARRIIKGAP